MGTTAEKGAYIIETKSLLKDKINNLGGSIDEQTTFRQYANQLQNVYDNLPKTEYQEGTEVNLGKTSKGKLDFDNGVVGIGQTEQDTTTGINLCENRMPTSSFNEIDCIKNNDGTYTLNGTATGGNATFRLDQTTRGGADNLKNYEDGTYTLSMGNSNSNVNFRIMQNETWANKLFINNGESIKSGTLSSATNCFIYVSVAEGTTLNNFKIYPMLVKGSYTASTLPPFEKYTGGQASPNPSYPQTINSVTGNQDVVVSGKNKFNIGTSLDDYFQTNTNGTKPGSWTVNAVTATIVGNKLTIDTYNSSGWNWLSKWVELEPNTDYTISGTNTSVLKIVGFNSNELQTQGTQIIQKTANASDSVKTFNSGDYKYYCLSCFPEATGKYFENIQIEQGSTATTYEPYITPTSYQLSLGDIELCGIGDYQDELIYDVDEDKVYKNEKIGKVIFTGNEGWTQTGARQDTFYLPHDFFDHYLYPFQYLYSNIAKFNKYINATSEIDETGSYIYVNGSAGFVYFQFPNITTLTEFKNIIQNSLAIYIQEPVLIEITDTTLINQVKALYNARSNNGTTIITSNGNLPMIIKVRGLKGE